MLHRTRHSPAQQAPRQQRADKEVPASLPDPVQHRPDERGEHGEGGHGDEQGQRHPATGLGHRGAEEQRPGQGHGDERVGRAARGGEFHEPVQAGPAGTGRLSHPVDEAGGAAGAGGTDPGPGGTGPGPGLRGRGQAAVYPPRPQPRAGQSHDPSILRCGEAIT
jgi:hypothetical protein